MTVITDANPYGAKKWSSINWNNVRRTVQRLQARIVKALKTGARRKVKDLQRLLNRSLAARLMAVKRVTSNKGSKTPGVDHIIWSTSKQKLEAVKRLKEPTKPKPLRRIYIPKKNGKKRGLGIPTMMDRACQALYFLGLDPISEANADPSSYGFRICRSTRDAIQDIHRRMVHNHSPQWVLEADIKACFDEINHQWLEKNIPMDKTTLNRWLKSGFMEGKKMFPTTSGTPQGGIISPVLANMTLDGLQQRLRETFGFPKTKHSRENKVYLCRYADDFIITGATKEILENEVKPLVEQFLEERGLKLSQEKTMITHVTEGFDFLGQNIRKYRKILLIKPSKKSIQSLKEKLKEAIRQYRCQSLKMIQKINTILRGWGNYHRFVSSKKTFSKLDNHIFWLLWNWAKKQHPNKGSKWIAKRYFHKIGSNKWVFSIKNKEKYETRFLLSSIPIRKYYSIKGLANPYDCNWKGYFEARKNFDFQYKHFATFETLHKKQDGTCPLCQQEIEVPKKGIIHFPKDNIATDKTVCFNNAVLVHKDCHKENIGYGF